MSDDRGSILSSLKRRLAALFAVTAAAVIAGGVAYNHSYRASLIRDSEKLLTSIEDFKIQQITYWRKDRLDDTMSLLDSPLLSMSLNALAANPSDASARALLSKRLNAYLRNNRYTEALLARMDGKVLVSAGKRSTSACPGSGAILAKADASGRPEMGDFNVLPGEKKPHIDLAARAAKGPAGKNLFLLLRIDPEDYIYPLIVKWPTNSSTGETLLVSREGNKIVYLNEIRHLAGAAMKLELPADTPDLPAAIAFTGKSGIVRGRDYRGVPVLASVSAIPGTNWAIVTKMDMAEVLAGSGRVSLLLLLLVLSLLGTAGAGAYLVFRRQAEEYRRSYAELDRQASALKDTYARLTAQANDAIIIADAQTLRIIETNRKSHEMYGYTEEEFSRLKISDLVPESGLARQRERLEAVRSGQGAVVEAEHKRKNGELFHAEVSASYTSGSGKEYIFAIVRDLSERTRMEQTLRDSEENYRQLFEAESDAIFLIDNENGEIKQANNAAAVLYGYTHEELLAMRNTDLSAKPEDTSKVTKTTPPDAGKIVVIPLRYHRKKSGEVFPVEITGRFFTRNGRPVHIVAIRDITERKKAEEKLRLGEERLRMAAEAAQFGVYDYDIETGVRSYSPEFLGLFGLPPGAALPLDADQAPAALYPEDREGFIAARRAGYDPLGAGLVDHEFRVILPTGLVRWLRVRGRTAFTGTGAGARPLRANGIIQDITERKQTEETLRESEERLRITLEETRIGTWDWDVSGDTWRASPTYFTMLGYPPVEGPSDRSVWLDRVHPDDREAVTERIREILNGGDAKYQYEARMRHADGSYRWHTVLGTTVKRGENGKPARIMGVRMDITVQKQAELTLRESEERYRSLFENMLNGFAYCRMLFENGKPADFVYLSVNKAFETLTGLKDVAGKKVSEVIPGIRETDPGLLETYGRVALGGKPETFETYVKALKMWFSISVYSPAKEHFVAVFDVITERKQAEEALKQSNALMDTTQHLAGIGGWEWDLAEKNIHWTEETYRIHDFDPGETGLGLEECVARSIECYRPEDRPAVMAAFDRCAEAGEPYDLEFPFTTAKGRRLWVRTTGQAERKGNKIVRLIGTLSDITERKRAELKLKDLNQDLIDRKQEMENFLYITTHDLRGPLVNIQGFSQNLERYLAELKESLGAASLPPGPKEALEKVTGERIPTALNFILESSRKMDALITALLKVSRLGRVEMKPEIVDMNGLIDKVAESLRYQLDQAGGEVKHGDLPRCKADPGAVSQLFANLLDNAIKYRQEGRPLSVSVTAELKEGIILYSVADNGSGIQEKDLGHIWDVFYRHGSAAGKGGEGIGLPMVKRLAEKNGGSITAESRPGEGSVFRVSLPAA